MGTVKRAGAWFLLAPLSLLLAMSACAGSDDGGTTDPEQGAPRVQESSPTPTTVTSPSGDPPCEDSAACTPRNVSRYLIAFQGRAHGDGYDTPSLEEVLERGLNAAGVSPVHLAFRGTADAGSVRCDWRGVARTVDQREDAVRLWLGLREDQSLPSPSALERQFMSYVDTMDTRFQPTMRSNFTTLARGGHTTDYVFLTCYVDYTVHEYLLGGGPATLTAAYDRRNEGWSYDLYRRLHKTGRFGGDPLMTEAEYGAELDGWVQDAEEGLVDLIGSRESIVFLAPMGAHNAIAVEVWQVVDQWDLQTDGDDVVHARRYGVSQNDPEHTQTLANLKSRVTTATASDAFANDRIEDASGLTQYYRDIGAYDDITPDDGVDTPFTPAQPPAARQ